MAKQSSVTCQLVTSSSRSIFVASLISASRLEKEVTGGRYPGRVRTQCSCRRARCKRQETLADSWNDSSFCVSTATLMGNFCRRPVGCSHKYLTSKRPDWLAAGVGDVDGGSNVFISGLSRMNGRFSATLSRCKNLSQRQPWDRGFVVGPSSALFLFS